MKKRKEIKVLAKLGLSPVSVILFVILGLSPLFAGSEYTVRLLVTCVMYGTLAMGFDLSAGYIGVANWGYSALMGVGAYTSALLMRHFGISPWIGMIAGGLLATLLGFLIGLLTLKMDGMFAALLAWFVGLILLNTATAWTALTNGQVGLQVESLFKTPWAKPYFYVIFVICVITYIAFRMLTQSNMGLAFRAIGQDMEAAQTSGVSPFKYRIINFCISCFLSGLVGGFYAHYMCILSPSLLATKNTITVLVIAYFGGRGSIWGPLLASFIINPVFESMNSLVELKYIIYGLILILIMIFMPDGLAGLIERIKTMITEKISAKNTAEVKIRGSKK